MNRVAIVLLGVVFLAASAGADPLQGQEIKFQQLPMINTIIDGTTYYGHDELSTAWKSSTETVYSGHFMADDFADTINQPVAHVTWWGSYMNDVPTEQVLKFMIVFENDVPNDANNPLGFSYPDPENYEAQIVELGTLSPGSGTYTEEEVLGSNPDETVYKYNAELACPFNQQADTVYWIKIVALVDEDPNVSEHLQWGWHNRDYTIPNPDASPSVNPGEGVVGTIGDTDIWHFQDDAVAGDVTDIELGALPCEVTEIQDINTYDDCYYVNDSDGPTGIGDYSKDLAFVLYTPEPATMTLLAVGAVALLRRRRR